MAGENIQLAQNTATDAAIPPADPALNAMPGDTGDLGTTGAGSDLSLDASPDAGVPVDQAAANCH